MTKVNSAGWRELYKKFIFMDCGDAARKNYPEQVKENDKGLILYGQIDKEGKLCFIPFKVLEKIDEEAYPARLFKGSEDVNPMMLADVDNCSFMYVDSSSEEYQNFSSRIDKAYEYAVADTDRVKIRKLKYLDKFRYREMPDVVKVQITENGLKREFVRARLKKRNDGLCGELLDRPHQNFGIGVYGIVTIWTSKNDEKLIAHAVPTDPDTELTKPLMEDWKKLKTAIGEKTKYRWECGVEQTGKEKHGVIYLGWGTDLYGENVITVYKKKESDLYEIEIDTDFYFKYLKDVFKAEDNGPDYYADNVSIDDLIRISESLKNRKKH